MTMSRETFDCHNWHLVGGDQGCGKNDLAEVEKALFGMKINLVQKVDLEDHSRAGRERVWVLPGWVLVPI
jgi:hypothetical protein